ncbi:MAG: hypothetical protein OJF49_000548 [Ktedonobacterales bacterium]|jgi:hypothetical protein|nr:MAG: hypothetical protein OJF49_000548 [Ktedonobacterales bacterium]
MTTTDKYTQMQLDDAVTPAHDVLRPDPLIVRLNKVFSWQQSAARWPYYLQRAESGHRYTKKEIVEEIFGESDGHRNEPMGKSWLTSILSLRINREYQEITIEGVGLFEEVGDSSGAYCITGDGLALAHAYSTDRSSNNWKRVFAVILARNDVRVRCVLLHLARWNCLLTFEGGSSEEAFFPKGKTTALRGKEGEETDLFGYSKGGTPAYSFTLLLQCEPYVILGPFLRERIERADVCVPENVCFEGGRDALNAKKEPSGNDLKLHMKQALTLYRDIGALMYLPHRQGWTLDRERCEEMFDPSLVADLFGGEAEMRFLNSLRATYEKLSDPEGMVHIVTIRDYVCDELDIPPGDRVDYFNRQVAYYLRPDVGKLGIGLTFHAQAGPSDCLFGDLTMERVEFRFAT